MAKWLNRHERRAAKAAAKQEGRVSEIKVIKNPEGFIRKFRTVLDSRSVAAMFSWRRLSQGRRG
jgi:hypothetical protein